MTKAIRCAAYVASAGSGLLIVASLFVMASLFNEVNDMYYEVIADVEDFKALANDAWKDMMAVKASRQGPVFSFESIFRHKRQYDAGVTGGTTSQGGGCRKLPEHRRPPHPPSIQNAPNKPVAAPP
uniref:Col_cuticle_N domain-containing protein n=2 Tax=Steinernema glaseri TaxID=37863 RepID=A0A1I7YPZ7_9BILA